MAAASRLFGASSFRRMCETWTLERLQPASRTRRVTTGSGSQAAGRSSSAKVTCAYTTRRAGRCSRRPSGITCNGIVALNGALLVANSMTGKLFRVDPATGVADQLDRVVFGDLTDPSLDIPTTVTVAAGRLWAVNLRFSTPPTPTTPDWITQLPLRR